MTDPTFLDLVDRLTRPTPQVIDTDDGLKRVNQDGLLHQLREAVFGGMEGTGGASAFGPKPPIDSSALDVLNLITNQATEVLRAVDPKPTPFGHAEKYVRLWAAQARPDQLFRIGTPATLPKDVRPDLQTRVYIEYRELTAYRLATLWVAQIEQQLGGRDFVEIKGTCPEPNCGADQIWSMVDGEEIPHWTLRRRIDKETRETIDYVCMTCGREWPKRDTVKLATLIGARPLPEFEEDTPIELLM